MENKNSQLEISVSKQSRVIQIKISWNMRVVFWIIKKNRENDPTCFQSQDK
jgi:hypothetical protein